MSLLWFMVQDPIRVMKTAVDLSLATGPEQSMNSQQQASLNPNVGRGWSDEIHRRCRILW